MTRLVIVQEASREADVISRDALTDDIRKRVRSVLAEQYANDPKLAYGIVTGAYTWPPINGEALTDLACQAANLADDLEELGAPSHRVDELRAAEQAFVWLDAESRQTQSEINAAYEDRPYLSGRRQGAM